MLTFTFLWLDLSLNHFHYQVWFCKFKHMSPLLCNVGSCLLMLWTACWSHLRWSRLQDPWRWSR